MSSSVSPAEAARELLKRRAARVDYASFCSEISPEEPPQKHHRIICDIGDRIVNGEAVNALILMPPGSAKSTYATVRFPPYYLGKLRKNGVICASYNDTLATRFGQKTRNIVASPAYKRIFQGMELAADSKAKGEWETNEGGFYFATGIG